MELKDVTILELDVPNANGRTYTSEVGQAIVDQLSSRQSVMGEVSMAPGMDVGESIDLARVSHEITNLRVENGKVLGTIKVMSTPMGNIAKHLIEAGASHGFRPRGYGTVGKDGVITNYSVVTIDMVQNPA